MNYMSWHRAFFFLCLFSIPHNIQAGRRPFVPSMKNLHVMTVTACDKKPNTTECDLVKKIYKCRMPRKAVISIEGLSYQYEAGIGSAIKNARYIYLMSRGYAKRKHIKGSDKDGHFIRKGGCVIHTRDRIAQKVVHLHDQNVAVTFDYQDSYVNFGQKRDLSCLKYVFDTIRMANPSAHIIIVGECLGSKTALELAAHYPIANTTLVLESPFFQATDLFEAMAQNYLGWSGFYHIIEWGCWAFAHYDWRQDDLPNRLIYVPKNIHMFSCHRNNDPLLHDDCFEKNMRLLTTHLGSDNVSCYRFDDMETRHSSTFRWKGSQQAVNAFYQKHGLPYCSKMLYLT